MHPVELLGGPGSGKSSIAGRLTESLPGAAGLETAALTALRRSGDDRLTRLIAHATRNSSSRLWRWAYARSTDRFSALTRFIDQHPDVLSRVTEAQRRRSDRDRSQDMVLGWVLNLMARYQLATEDPGVDGCLVIDEGFCQRAVALFGYGFQNRDAPLLQEYLEAIPLPDVVVVVDTPLEVCEARLEKRGWSQRVAQLDFADRHDFLLGTSAVVDAVTAFLETTRARVVRVDGTNPADSTARSLAATLAG